MYSATTSFVSLDAAKRRWSRTFFPYLSEVPWRTCFMKNTETGREGWGSKQLWPE